MEEYKSNSYRSKELQKKETNENNKPQDRKVEKVVTGVVKTKKKKSSMYNTTLSTIFSNYYK